MGLPRVVQNERSTFFVVDGFQDIIAQTTLPLDSRGV